MSTLDETIEQQVGQNDTANQYGVASIPFHNHEGIASPAVSFQNLVNRNEFVTIVIQGTSAQTSSNYGVMFISPFAGFFKGVMEVHTISGSSTPTLQIEKLTGTTVTGLGINLLQTPFNLAGTANTVQTGKLANIPNNAFNVKVGDRIGLSVTGTLTTLSHVVVVIQLQY